MSADLPGLVDGSIVLGPEARHHVETCLRCQAEVAQYRRVVRSMRHLRGQYFEPAPGLLGDILGAVGDAAERQAVRAVWTTRRVAYLGGLAAATAAGAAGAIALAARNRRVATG